MSGRPAPEGVWFSQDHVWAHVRAGSATLGLTALAVDVIGAFVYVDLPAVGLRVKRGENVATVEAGKAAFDVVAPLSGVVTRVNRRLESDPGLASRCPCSRGWLLRMSLDDVGEVNDLLSGEQYAQWLGRPDLRQRFEAPSDRGY